ncbi:MAG: NAD(P)/FAD-dependent oxidoreductase [Candidatus Omnitrophica bacterium]|nr:NAD(P)/FAD-dependent oxidoreductase [Candidatus Omnitrophota bacterium]
MKNNRLRYAVIGGGAAGCALAWHLTRNGHDVHLYEREKGLGGLASDIPFGRTRLDRFYHHIFTSDTHVQAYAERLGLASKLHWCESSVGVEYRGTCYPFTTPVDLLRFRPLSLLSRLRVGLAVLKMRRRATFDDLEEITAEEWIIREMGEPAYRVLWEPLLRSKFGDKYREVSAVWFWGKVKLRGGTRSKSGAGERLGYLKDGWGQLYERMGEEIAARGGIIRLHELVREIRSVPGGLAVRTRSGEETFQRVLFTPSVPMLLQTVPSLPDGYRAFLSRIPYQANITMVLGLERSLSPYYWLNITDPDSPFVAVIEHTNLFRDPDYGGLIPVYLSRYLSPDHPFYTMKVPALRERFLSHLEQLFPHFRREWIQSFTFSKAEYAQPVIGLHYSKNKPLFQTPVEGLFLCTMVQIYPEDRGMNYSIKCAEELLCALGELERLTA